MMLAVVSTSISAVARADGFYDGETITLIMGLDASAGGTTVGRLMAKHLELGGGGNPNVSVQKMPGGSMMSERPGPRRKSTQPIGRKPRNHCVHVTSMPVVCATRDTARRFGARLVRNIGLVTAVAVNDVHMM